jgi:alpha-L-rhamnosidase
MAKTTLCTAVFLLVIAGQCLGGMTVERLRCEYQNDPLGIDVVKPRLSWIVQSDERAQRQTAYQVLVASSP